MKLKNQWHKLIAVAIIVLAIVGLSYGGTFSVPADKTNLAQMGDKRTDSSPNASDLLETSASIPKISEEIETPSPSPTPFTPDLVEREKVEDTFFENTAIFGNSLVDGLRLFGGMENADFFAATSASVVSVKTTKSETMPDGSIRTLLGKLLYSMQTKKYDKVYIELGINEIGFAADYFIEEYAEIINQILEVSPDIDIYVMSITPITYTKSTTNDYFTISRINTYNEALYELAKNNEYYYIDLFTALSDENGFLPAEDSSDGVHFNAGKYLEWADYLRTHYA